MVSFQRIGLLAGLVGFVFGSHVLAMEEGELIDSPTSSVATPQKRVEEDHGASGKSVTSKADDEDDELETALVRFCRIWNAKRNQNGTVTLLDGKIMPKAHVEDVAVWLFRISKKPDLLNLR